MQRTAGYFQCRLWRIGFGVWFEALRLWTQTRLLPLLFLLLLLVLPVLKLLLRLRLLLPQLLLVLPPLAAAAVAASLLLLLLLSLLSLLILVFLLLAVLLILLLHHHHHHHHHQHQHHHHYHHQHHHHYHRDDGELRDNRPWGILSKHPTLRYKQSNTLQTESATLKGITEGHRSRKTVRIKQADFWTAGFIWMLKEAREPRSKALQRSLCTLCRLCHRLQAGKLCAYWTVISYVFLRFGVG